NVAGKHEVVASGDEQAQDRRRDERSGTESVQHVQRRLERRHGDGHLPCSPATARETARGEEQRERRRCACGAREWTDGCRRQAVQDTAAVAGEDRVEKL